LRKINDESRGQIFEEVKNPPMNNAGTIVFSKAGFVTVGKEKNAPSEYISHD
jgi:hypothetical protein